MKKVQFPFFWDVTTLTTSCSFKRWLFWIILCNFWIFSSAFTVYSCFSNGSSTRDNVLIQPLISWHLKRKELTVYKPLPTLVEFLLRRIVQNNIISPLNRSVKLTFIYNRKKIKFTVTPPQWYAQKFSLQTLTFSKRNLLIKFNWVEIEIGCGLTFFARSQNNLWQHSV